jgi:hypothetical protein
MLEPHLAEKKIPRRIKMLIPWTSSLGKVSPCHVTLRKQEGCLAARWWLQTCLGDTDQQVSKSVAHGIPTANPGINQHKPLNILTPIPQKKYWITNKELKRNTKQRAQGTLSSPEKGRRARRWPLHELSKTKTGKANRPTQGGW